MRGLQKSKRLSWASGVNLCQVRLFLSEESPSQVGLDSQDKLQAKTSWPQHSTAMGSDDNLPPGFEGADPADLLKNKLSQIPLIKWRYPPRFVLDPRWLVVAGGESKEVEVQNQREMRMLEAVYPRPSAIPLNPSLLLGNEDYDYNDKDTPLIPLTPIEDEETAVDTSLDSVVATTMTMTSLPSLSPLEIPSTSQCSASNYHHPPVNGNPKPDVAAAAYAALTSVMTNNDPGNLIDSNLLMKILSDPKLIENLVTDHNVANTGETTPKPRLPGVTLPNSPAVQVNRTEAAVPSLGNAPSAPFYPPPHMVEPVPNPRSTPPEVIAVPSQPLGVLPPVAKDINYYKSLIQQHGGERQETPLQYPNRHNRQLVGNVDSVHILNSGELKPKIMKPCVYFNSSRGCRRGANCSYQHDALSQQQATSIPDVQSAKRMKVEREIRGI